MSLLAVKTPVVQTDKDLLDALGMSESEAARVLGRSRQSLYQAKLSERDNYFKKEEVRDLAFAAKSANPDLDLGQVIEFAAQSRSPDLAEMLAQIDTLSPEAEAFLNYKELWVVLPDVGWIYNSYPHVMETLIKLAGRPAPLIRFFTSAPLDKSTLEYLLESHHSHASDITCASWMGAIPPVIIGNPLEKADTFILTNGRFMPNDWYGGRNLAVLIQTLFDTPPPPSRVVSLAALKTSNTDNRDAGIVGELNG